MKTFKVYGSLVLCLLSVFLLGAYTCALIDGAPSVEAYEWVLTSLVGFMFLIIFLDEYRR